jgi:hypothetical protein
MRLKINFKYYSILALVIPLYCQSSGVLASVGAVLQGLDKVTARIERIEALTDKPIKFGSLSILVRTCVKKPPEELPESAAFLEIKDARAGEEGMRVFSGWMFASSPSLSAMEHAVYDVWVVDCINELSDNSSSSR